MNHQSSLSDLRKAIDETGNGWWLDELGEDSDSVLGVLALEIELFRASYGQRFGEEADPYSLIKANPLKARAFFQPDTLRLTTEMKIAVWRIMRGCEVQRIDFHFDADADEVASLTLTLRPPHGPDEEYKGFPFRDYCMLRHLGMTFGRKNNLAFNGYYSLK